MPADVDRLLAKFEGGALLRPGAGAPSLVDLAQAVWRAAGVSTIAPTEAARALEARIGAPEHLVIVMADGLGLDLLESMPAASFLWQHLAGALRTVFPSSTAVALTSFHTASWPAEHGVTGHWLAMPQGTVTVLSYATRSDGRPLDAVGMHPGVLFPRATMLGQVPRATLFVAPDQTATGGFTDYLAAGVARRGYRSLAEGVDAVIEFVRTAAGPTCTMLYVSRVDDAAHQHGPVHLEVVGAVRALDAEMARLASALGGGGRIVLTADHGHLPIPRGGHRVLRMDDEAGRLLQDRATGDVRALSLVLRPDADRSAFAAAFEERFGEQFLLLTVDDVESLGLLGPAPLTPLARGRLGDYLAVSLGGDILECRPSGARADPRFTLRSHHSGLTPAEMRIPLVII